jgi:hypothetical protein
MFVESFLYWLPIVFADRRLIVADFAFIFDGQMAKSRLCPEKVVCE